MKQAPPLAPLGLEASMKITPFEPWHFQDAPRPSRCCPRSPCLSVLRPESSFARTPPGFLEAPRNTHWRRPVMIVPTATPRLVGKRLTNPGRSGAAGRPTSWGTFNGAFAPCQLGSSIVKRVLLSRTQPLAPKWRFGQSCSRSHPNSAVSRKNCSWPYAPRMDSELAGCWVGGHSSRR